mmetsp:Transcript_7734/g.20906  ORF Transcript_7734/g.20906 Transcript_7734/m.20906 type:complete len:140 (-) Transcript_7734:1076-1495(-)
MLRRNVVVLALKSAWLDCELCTADYEAGFVGSLGVNKGAVVLMVPTVAVVVGPKKNRNQNGPLCHHSSLHGSTEMDIADQPKTVDEIVSPHFLSWLRRCVHNHFLPYRDAHTRFAFTFSAQKVTGQRNGHHTSARSAAW